MKHLARILSLFLLVSASLFYVSCDNGDDSQSEEETQLGKLKSDQWTLTKVMNDGTDRTSEYPGMTLVISGTYTEGGTYSYTSNATSWPDVSPWKKDDQWKFKAGAVGNTIVRQADLKEIGYTLSNSDKTLDLNFEYLATEPGFSNGRTKKVDGEWTFTFSRP